MFLHSEKGYSCRQIAFKVKISKSSVSRILKEDFKSKREKKECDKMPGRPCLLSVCDERKLCRSVTRLRLTNPNFTAMDVIQDSGIERTRAKYRTFVSYLNKLGYKFRQTRKKGHLCEKDFQRRRKYARKALKLNSTYWTKDVGFYLDGVSFVHKGNPLNEAVSPRSRVWRKANEGLSLTSTGSKNLAGGKRVHVMVAIAPRKGVILAEVYEKMSGHYFSDLIRRKFLAIFRRVGKTRRQQKIFVMDNCPSQTSAMAMDALQELGIELKRIPPRSPDLNPIENLFHVVKRKLRQDAINKAITEETFDEFVIRVKSTLLRVSTDYINRMPKRVKEIIRRKGRRIKY